MEDGYVDIQKGRQEVPRSFAYEFSSIVLLVPPNFSTVLRKNLTTGSSQNGEPDSRSPGPPNEPRARIRDITDDSKKT